MSERWESWFVAGCAVSAVSGLAAAQGGWTLLVSTPPAVYAVRAFFLEARRLIVEDRDRAARHAFYRSQRSK